MALVDLLNPDDPMFAFQHAMSHRNYLGQMAPLTRFSSIPYWLDPIQAADKPSSNWNINHTFAHRDFITTLPAAYSPNAPQPPSSGLFIGEDLRDYNLANDEQRRWWTFANQQEHYNADAVTLPMSATRPNMTFPFW
jgi:hypothetical protein